MFAVSYSLIFAWHPELCLPRQMVVRGYNHSLEQLSDMSYLTSEQLAMRNQITASQLQDCILNVDSKKGNSRNVQFAIAEMFNTELKFACDVLMCWFNEKFRKTRVNLSNADSTQYRRLNPITSDTKCVICDFGIEVEPKGLKYKENNTSYLDFLIKKEYSFLKNIFDENHLKESKSICNLENYYDKMQLFLYLIKVSEIELKSASFFNEISDDLLEGFLTHQYDVEGLVENEIKKFEVKHNKTMKMPKFTLQLYSFLYDCLMNFPSVKSDEIKTVATRGFMKEIYSVVNFKVHIHHSHVAGKIHGYSHDVCNWKVRENQLFVPLIGHNFLGFDIYYMVKGYRSVTWGTKEFHMGGINLTNVNFANISSQVKIIETLKYYQTSLANISSTANEIEKRNIKESINFFLKKHYYFSDIWSSLDKEEKDKILDIISKGKGALPYEKIVDKNSLDLIPEKEFFEYTEFFSKLNGCNIGLEIYENMKYLYTIFKNEKFWRYE